MLQCVALNVKVGTDRIQGVYIDGHRAGFTLNRLYRKGRDRLVHQMLTVPVTINPEKSLLWDPDPGPSSPSRTWLAAQKARTSSQESSQRLMRYTVWKNRL